MGCEKPNLGPGTVLFACRRGVDAVRCKCGRRSELECDYPLRGKKYGTICGRPLCRSCAVVIALVGLFPVGNYCPAHAKLTARHG